MSIGQSGSNFGANQYKKNAITTASRGQILILLYEGAIRNVKLAIIGIEKKNIAEKGKAIGKAHDIINELGNTLNFEVGGAVATDLERLYSYITEQLLTANLNNTKEPLENVQKILETLLAGWKVAVEQFNKETSQK